MNKEAREQAMITFAGRIKHREDLGLSQTQQQYLVNILAGVLAKSRRETAVLAVIGATVIKRVDSVNK